MVTRVLIDIRNDLKLLISAITGFEDTEEGFDVCERFTLSNIKNHRYLSIDGNETKQKIDELITKFSIHGKYKVAKELQYLISCFLHSFDFEQHPQYDLQWALLSLLLDLANETTNSDLNSHVLPKNEYNVIATVDCNNGASNEIDWGPYLKESQEEFFYDFQNSTESEWSDEEVTEVKEVDKWLTTSENDVHLFEALSIRKFYITQYKLSKIVMEGLVSKNWLSNNVQNCWWYKLEQGGYQANSSSQHANFSELWDKANLESLPNGTRTLSEYQFCRELLWMFYVQARMTVFQQQEWEYDVIPNISIPSLSNMAFNNILQTFCEYFTMIRKLEDFGKYLKSNYVLQNVYRQPPLTYESYYAVLAWHLTRVKRRIIKIERNFMKQDTCNSFLTLLKDLKKHLETIKILYEIHQAVISDWKVYPNCKCASSLLSCLYFEMENSNNKEKANISASLYLSSLRVYLNIIDTWLNEGRLEDWRDEFIISRVPIIITDAYDVDQREQFTIRGLDAICLKDPIMRLLLDKVGHMGKNIGLLVSLDRISDIWKMTADGDVTRVSLNDELMKEIILEFANYNYSKLVDEKDVALSFTTTENISLCPHDSNIEENIIQQMTKMENPFLIKVLEKYLSFNMIQKDKINGMIHSKFSNVQLEDDIYYKLEKMSEFVLPCRKVLKNTLSKILILRYSGASKLVKDIMLKEHKLDVHLKIVKSVYMMEMGHVMNKFCKIIFTEIETNAMWNNSNFLTSILEEILSQEWSESNSRWSIITDPVLTYQVLRAIDGITLHYAIDWPVSMFLNEETLKIYNEIFRFQLKLNWALWTLKNLKFSDLEGSKLTNITKKVDNFYAKRLQCLRFWLIHAIGSVHAYVTRQVLQRLGFVLEKALNEVDDLDTIIAVHNKYLQKMREHCFLTLEFQDLMVTINNLFYMCVRVQNKWKSDSSVTFTDLKELELMESGYVSYHTHLALALHNAVQHKDADYCKNNDIYGHYRMSYRSLIIKRPRVVYE